MKIKAVKDNFKYIRSLPVNYSSEDQFRFDPIKECVVEAAFLEKKVNLKVCQYYIFSGTVVLEEFCLPIQKRGKIKFFKHWLKMQIFPSFRVESAFWVSDTWSKNYFHWILECLPRILEIKKAGIKDPLLLPEHIFNAPYVKESLADFGVDCITYTLRQTVNVENLYIINHDLPCAFDPKYINGLISFYNKIDGSQSERGFRKIFISRQLASKRKISNEEAMLPILDEAGFELIFMENLIFKEQRNLMRQTQVLISIHGAGLANLIFMPASSQIVELHPDTERYNSCFYHLASAIEMDYYYSFEKGDHQNPQEASITIDLEKFKKLLKEL